MLFCIRTDHINNIYIYVWRKRERGRDRDEEGAREKRILLRHAANIEANAITLSIESAH